MADDKPHHDEDEERERDGEPAHRKDEAGDARPESKSDETESDPQRPDAGEGGEGTDGGERPARSEREEAYRREGREFIPLARELSLRVYDTDHYFRCNGLAAEDVLTSLFVSGFYHKLSSRRHDFILEDMLSRGLIWKKPAPNTLLYHKRQKALTPILLRLIGVAALPFQFYDWGYAMDATKIFTSVYLDEEAGEDGRRRFKWLKLHLLSGVKSQAVMAARVTPWPAHEMKYLEPLLREALARGFEVKSLTADRGYIIKDNVRLLHDLGITSYVTFKRNNRKSKKGADPGWDEDLERFRAREGVELIPYRERNMAETVNSSIKRKFGRSVRGIDETAQINETLLKVNCHNLCRLNRFHLKLNDKYGATD